jgi:6-phosphofructokinase 1
MKQRADIAKKLFHALESCPDMSTSGWELLFDEAHGLIDCEVDGLKARSEFPHPLRSFYVQYGRRMWGAERTIFTPYEATVLVNDDHGVLEVFRRLKAEALLPRFAKLGAREVYKLDPQRQNIGILTAGGNAPGLNTVIDSVVKRHCLLATKAGASQDAEGYIKGMNIYGYLGGYNGLISGEKVKLHPRKTDPISLQAGSILGIKRGQTPGDLMTSKQCDRAAAEATLANELVKGIKRDKLDILYVIGGNGTITAAASIAEHLQSTTGAHGLRVRVVAAPKTMDNDVNFTDVTFGFRTTVGNAVEVIQRIHLEAETCGRIGIIELFGANSGFVALHASYASGQVDYVLIPEMMTGAEDQKADELQIAIDCLAKRYKQRGHAILVVAEGATSLGKWKHGNSGAKQSAFDLLVDNITTDLKKRSGGAPPIFTSVPKHLIRSTPPNSSDVDLCKQTGKLMVDAALSGLSGCVVSLWHGQFVAVPMRLATAKLKRVDMAGYYVLSMMEKYLL